MKKTNDPWAAYRDRRGNVDFDAMPEEVKLAFIRESENAPAEELSRAERRRFEKWRKRAVGRPRVGQGFQRWNVSLEKGFARQVAHYAKTHGISRSRVLAEGAKMLLESAA
jgi:hypothetical protein